MSDRDTRIREALNPLFWWAKEPALIVAALSSAIVASIDYWQLTGHDVDDALIGLIIAWISVLGLIVRSQYTPYANQ